MYIEQVESYHFTPEEADRFLAGWWRVVDDDGSTFAYVPDKITAELVIAFRQVIDWLAGTRLGSTEESPHGLPS